MEKPQREINGKVAIAIPECQEQFLLLRRSEQNSSSGEWVFPGGKIEENETPKKAAERELKEETGLEGEVVRSGETYVGEGELGLWKMYPFYVKVESTEVELDHEHSMYKWLKLEELKEHDTMGSLKSLKALNII